MRIKTVRDAAKFIFNWTNSSTSFPGGPNPLSQSVPEPVRVLDELLGAFWEAPPYPIKPIQSNHNTERGLFRVQDEIVNPRTARVDGNVTPLVHENQGVWSFGYSKNQKLMIRGDWVWSAEQESNRDWVTFPAEIEDVLVFTLLMNFFFYHSNDGKLIEINANNLDTDERHIVLWSHRSWSAFRGFYTDHDAKLLVLDGFGAIERA